jgi:hypothetical protein
MVLRSRGQQDSNPRTRSRNPFARASGLGIGDAVKQVGLGEGEGDGLDAMRGASRSRDTVAAHLRTKREAPEAMLYAAIDIHKRTFHGAVLDAEAGETSERRFGATREELNDWMS